MDGRDRLRATIRGRETDRLCWSSLVDGYTLGLLPEPLKGMDCFDLYRYMRCDVVQLGGWGTPWGLEGCRLVMPGVETVHSVDDSGNAVLEKRCSRGVLKSRRSPYAYPVERPVKTIEDLRLLTHRWESAFYEALDESAAFCSIDSTVGSLGVTTLFAAPSVIPSLLETEMGVEQFYYMMADYPDEMDYLIRLMQEKELLCFELWAQSQCEVLILAENTSTRFISPGLYARYNLASQRAFAEACHRHGKTAILHMCGHVKDLLPLIRETGADGIHALTPAPTGDTPWEHALDVLGEDTIIMGVVTPDILQQYPLDEVGPALDKLVTPRLRESRFVLLPMADGIPTPIERFLAVRDWVEKTG